MNETTTKKEQMEKLHNSINKQYENIKENIPEAIECAYKYYILCAYLKMLSKYEPVIEYVSLEKLNNQMENCLEILKTAMDYVLTIRESMNCENKSGNFLEDFLDICETNEQDILLKESIKQQYQSLDDDFKNISIMDYKGLVTSIMMIVLFDISADDLEKHNRFMNMFYKKLSSIISITDN